MQGIVVETVAGEPVLTWQTVPDVSGGPDDVVVDVHATAVNRADLSQARGNYPPPPGASPILGLEMAGVVAEVGPAVRDWQVGDRVCALLPGGGYAERVVVPGGMLMRVPDDWSLAQAAAVPEVWFTAHVNLFGEANLTAGEAVLIHAGASGVGTAAIQLARSVGATVYATAGSAEKIAACRDLGATLAVNYKEADFAEAIAAVSSGVDVILDPVGGSYLARNVRLLRPFGRLVSIGLLDGRFGELDMGALLRKRLRLIGSTLRARPVAEKIAVTRDFTDRFWPLLRSGALRPVIDRTFPVQAAQAAHAYVAANRNTGKVILLVHPEAAVR